MTKPAPLSKVTQTSKHRDNGRYYVETAPLPFALNKLAVGYRSMGKVNGWETALSYQRFGGVHFNNLNFRKENLSLLLNSISLELGYLPHVSFFNSAFYFGIGGGIGIAKDATFENLSYVTMFTHGEPTEDSIDWLRDQSKWVAYPTVYIKPGFQFHMKNKDKLTHHVDLKVSYPFNASLNYGLGF